MSLQESSPSQATRELARCHKSSAASGRRRGGAVALRRIDVAELTIRRRRNGHGVQYIGPGGRPIREPRVLSRFKRLAVPPAYEDVRYAADPDAYIRAVGRDIAGRMQYRYHPDWDKVREQRKARHRARLIRLLPGIRAAVSRHLRDRNFSCEFAIAAVIDLIACAAIRPGSEAYLREHGTRGVATLLKSMSRSRATASS